MAVEVLKPDSPINDFEFPYILCWTCCKHIILLWRRDQDKQEQIDRVLAEHEGHDFTLYA
jgi:hypothetical protein